jgi:hypothetical protein
MNGASWAATEAAEVCHGRARAYLVASFAEGVSLSSVSNGNSGCPLHIDLSIATFRCSCTRALSPLVDERRVVAGDVGGSVRTRRPGGDASPRRPAGHRRACATLVASFAAGVAVWMAGGRSGGCLLRGFDGHDLIYHRGSPPRIPRSADGDQLVNWLFQPWGSIALCVDYSGRD